jgi:hypothetical protein
VTRKSLLLLHPVRLWHNCFEGSPSVNAVNAVELYWSEHTVA